MKFSIVIATYNRLSLLKRAIDSALSQTEGCEVIVVDDGSSDATADYVQGLGSQVIFCRNDRNQGHSVAMNIGVKAAQGDWIKCLDDDDYLDSNCIEILGRAIALHPAAVICSCQAKQVRLNGREINITPRIGQGKAIYIPQSDIHYGMLLEQIPLGTTSQVAFRREACLKAGGWNPALNTNTCDDTDAWLRIADFGDALFVNQCLVYRTVWPGNYSQQSTLIYKRDINLAIKAQIYDRVSEQHRGVIPTWQDIQVYLDLHWGLVALKQRQFLTFFALVYPAILNVKAWKILFSASLVRWGALSHQSLGTSIGLEDET